MASAGTMARPARARQVRGIGFRTSLDPDAIACGAYAELVRGLRLADPMATYFRKARSLSQMPNPLARALRDLARAKDAGAPEPHLRIFAVTCTSFVDAICDHATRLDFETLKHGIELEFAQTQAQLRVIVGDRDAETLRTFAKAKRREALHDLALADAADIEATRQMRSA